MHRVRFLDPAGSVRTGSLVDDHVVTAGRRYDRDRIEFLPPAEPTKLIGVGLNYADHAEEMEMEPPDRPRLFLMPPNVAAGPGAEVALPAGKDRVDYEAELAVVIGRQCRNASPEDALEFVGGYTCLNDISNRDDQRVERNYVRGKAFDNAAPFGPAIATPGDVPDDATIRLRIDGDLRQDSSLDQMLFTVPELIVEITRYLTLEPGDVIATGTPPGVGPLAPGNEVEIEIEGIGSLRHSIADDPA